MRPTTVTLLTALLLACASASPAIAADWPQFLGPTRDAIAPADETITDHFPATGPPIVWSTKVGRGWAGPVIATGHLILFDRIEDDDRVQSLDPLTGKPHWAFTYPARYRDAFGFDPGPRATPAIDGSRVYTYGAQGMLHCLDLATGKKLWECDTAKQFKSAKGFFGRACSPLIDEGRVVLQVGGTDGAGIVAFDKLTGAVAWKALSDEAGYSSPTLANLAGHRRLICLMRSGLAILDPATGQVVYQRDFRSQMDASVNAASPIVIGDTLLLSASYQTGALALQFQPTGDPKELWANDDSLSAHYSTPVSHSTSIFGFHGRADSAPGPILRCIDLATGNVRWSSEPLGSGSIIRVDKQLIILTEHGDLILAPASPTAYKPTATAHILGGELRSPPALSNAHLYARDKTQLICLDLRPATP